MKKLTLLLSAMLMTVMSFAGEYSVTISFADKAQRTVYTTEQQVWEQNGIIVTNDKSESTTNIGDYANPVRFYKSSALTVKCTLGTIKKMEFTCGTYSGKDYPAELVASVGSEATAEGLVVTIVPTASSDTYTIASLVNQVRVASISVTYDGEAPENGGDNGGDNGGTTPPANPEGVITCAQAVEICQATGETATTETYTIRGYVTEIKYAWSEQYGTATFWIADTQDGGQVLQAYSCAPLTDADKVFAVGAYVELVGKLKKYKETCEVEKGTYTVITAADGGTTPPTPPTPPTDLVGAGTADNPYTVEDVIALNNTLTGTHYVKGYIIGQVNGASISSGLDTEAPFEGSTNSDGSVATQGTNLMIASAQGETTTIVPVALPKGELRDAFNLVENPDMLGVEVLICGELIKYFGVPGIKNPTSIEVIGGGDPNVVTITGLQYADAYYYEYEGVAYYDIDLYKGMDPETYEYIYPDLYLMVEAKSKTALNGTYDLWYAGLWTTANDSVEMGEALGTVTIKNKDENGNYSFVGSYVGTDGKTYKFNQVVAVTAYDADADYEEIVLKEETTDPGTDPGTGTDPVVPEGAIVFDADVDKGNASTDSNNPTAYTVSKSGVTLEVSSGILGTYNNEMHYRVYKNQTLTVTSTVGNIAKIEFTCTANDDEKYGPGCFTADGGDYTYSGAVGTWSGDAETVIFTASANQVRATQIVVTLANATGVENVIVGGTPVKVIENGQLMIIRGENVYNVLGAQVK